ncbi:hypothetical protein HELRODRAFT_168740 [Helobdella robusta]|uniref:NR LBD domain-containing protein n=1 Tax=Helobdella robusta TaxID=6412 RepID=T1F0W7_HELRO|nr:hypothetical protein HELRODRAFT_168740 [Helobdella robusta]ESO08829.1 hypothetical protein HELRODRAFT_168740 [Helobdella robusta]
MTPAPLQEPPCISLCTVDSSSSVGPGSASPYSLVAMSSRSVEPGARPKLLFNLLSREDEDSDDDHLEDEPEPPGGQATRELDSMSKWLTDVFNFRTSHSVTSSSVGSHNSFFTGCTGSMLFGRVKYDQSWENLVRGVGCASLNEPTVLFSNGTTQPPIRFSGTALGNYVSVPSPPIFNDEQRQMQFDDSEISRPRGEFLFKKRKVYEDAVKSTFHEATSGEKLIKSKRLKIDPNYYFQTLKHSYEKEKSPKGSLLKKILCSNSFEDDDDVSDDSSDVIVPSIEKALAHTTPEYELMTLYTQGDDHYDQASRKLAVRLADEQLNSSYNSRRSPDQIYSKCLSTFNEYRKPMMLSKSSNESILSFLKDEVQFAYSLPEFTQLPYKDQRHMLVAAMSRLLVLHIASQNIQLEVCQDEKARKFLLANRNVHVHGWTAGFKPMEEFLQSLNMVISKFQQDSVTQLEYYYLKFLALFNYNGVHTTFRQSLSYNFHFRK